MRTTKEKVWYALQGLLISDDPALERVIIEAEKEVIHETAEELNIVVEVIPRGIMEPRGEKVTVVKWVRIICQPMEGD